MTECPALHGGTVICSDTVSIQKIAVIQRAFALGAVAFGVNRDHIRCDEALGRRDTQPDTRPEVITVGRACEVAAIRRLPVDFPVGVKV
jgi:hypothetical protein